MPSKKPSSAPLPAGAAVVSPAMAKSSTQPPTRRENAANPPNPRQQPDNRWQRSKRYGWDSR